MRNLAQSVLEQTLLDMADKDEEIRAQAFRWLINIDQFDLWEEAGLLKEDFVEISYAVAKADLGVRRTKAARDAVSKLRGAIERSIVERSQ
jgi:hypothetical protein|tara:strand:+ start:1542 stop:1814 length:273 start_codon:yes stop_codon:yes gene_type:complete